MTRQQIYSVLDGERNYQNQRWVASHDSAHCLADWLLFMEHHLNKAKNALYFLSPDHALEEMRKVTALGIACFEQKGVPERIPSTGSITDTTIKKELN